MLRTRQVAARLLARGFAKQAVTTPDHTNFDVICVGGGAMGSSTAFHLAERGFGNVAVIERDLTYTRASTTLSIGNIRSQFSNPENVQMSVYGADFFRAIKEKCTSDPENPATIDFVEDHYLFLAGESAEQQMRDNHKIHEENGAITELLTPEEISKLYPWLNLDGIALGSLGHKNEGWFDPYLLLNCYSKKAMSNGVTYIKGNATGIKTSGDRITGVTVIPQGGGDPFELSCDRLVNCAGPWAFDVMRMCGLEPMPIERRLRQVFSFTCADPPPKCPMVVDASGVYFRREGDHGLFISGGTPAVGEVDVDTPDDGMYLHHDYFEQRNWPALAQRVTAFEGVKVTGGWAGFYEYNTFDQNGIIGYHPSMSNLLLCNGFSGHGAMQSPAVGRAMAELIIDGKFTTLDLSRFHLERIARGESLKEKSVV